MSLDVRGTVVYPYRTGHGDDASYPDGADDPMFKKRILCEGDSWFSIGGTKSGNLLEHTMFRQSTMLFNLAKPGDTIKRMSTIAQNPDLHRRIGDSRFLTQWDAILLSGGGNDLIDEAHNIICEPSEGAGESYRDYINGLALAVLEVEITQSYVRIASLREGPNANTPIFAHVYDYPTPRNAPAKFLGFKVGGPWFYKALRAASVPERYWISISDYLFEWLGGVIIRLQTRIDNFHVIANTRDTLIRARLNTTGVDGDWANEIHPTDEGYAKMADVVSGELDRFL